MGNTDIPELLRMSKQFRDECDSLVDKYNKLALKSMKSEFDHIDLKDLELLISRKENTIVRILFPLLIKNLSDLYTRDLLEKSNE